MGLFPSFGPGRLAQFRDNSGTSLLQRIGSTLQKSDDGGVTYGSLGATLSSGAAVPARSDLSSFLTGNSLQFRDNSGTSIVTRLGGVLVKSDDGGLTFGALGATLATGSFTPPPGILTFAPGNRATFTNGSGTSILERIAGFLQVSDDNGVTFGPLGVTFPGTPKLRFSAQNVDGLNNSSMIDGQQVGTWTNIGSLGAAANAIQATAGLRPLFALVASAGKLNNKSAVRGNGARWVRSASITPIVQPMLVSALAMTTTIAAGTFVINDAITGPNRPILFRSTASYHIFAGTDAPTASSFVANSYHSVNGAFNGAASVGRMDGVASSGLATGAGSMDGVSLFADNANGEVWNGDIVEFSVHDDGTTAAQVEAYYLAAYGATPQ